MKYRLNSNLHTHSDFCDGKSDPEKYILAALEKNFTVLGFSSHAPVKIPSDWHMKKENLLNYFNTLKKLQIKYKDKIDILIGLEVDYIPGIISPTQFKNHYTQIDYIIGSVHYLGQLSDGSYWTVDGSLEEFKLGLKGTFNNDIQKCVKKYYQLIQEMIQISSPDIIGHLDLIKMNNINEIFFKENEDWYKDELENVTDLMAKAGCTVEINTGGIARKKIKALYPSEWILEIICRKKIPVIINSDAHRPEEIDGFYDNVLPIIKNIGFKQIIEFKNSKKQKVFI